MSTGCPFPVDGIRVLYGGKFRRERLRAKRIATASSARPRPTKKKKTAKNWTKSRTQANASRSLIDHSLDRPGPFRFKRACPMPGEVGDAYRA